ncbi:hypothetical protein [Salipiger mucosus]|uniref:hypothetical protein n=1 Tax=Salipiger mucosus TaxID=263378 RepID=UPI0012EB431C|nr:hypothetical protein [Salipiger mucosus]
MKHPNRYPKHSGDKGTVFGGICNTTRCNQNDAQFFNVGTHGYYCVGCARGINRFTPGLCARVDHDLDLEEMDAQAAQIRPAS